MDLIYKKNNLFGYDGIIFTSAKMVSEVIQGKEKMKYESDTKHEGIHMC